MLISVFFMRTRCGGYYLDLREGSNREMQKNAWRGVS
jgi:hypothetical protein